MSRRDLLGPMLFKELSTQLRGSRGAIMITAYVGLVLIAARLFYGVTLSQLDYGKPLLSAEIGQVLFIGLSLMVQGLTLLIAPATTVSTISQEYERGTLELVMATPLSAFQLIAGKLLAALAFLLLLLLAVLPAFTLVLLFGGVTAMDVARVLAVALMTAVVGSAVGLLSSTITRRTYSATLLCYMLLICLVGGTLFAANVWSLVNGFSPAPPALVAANPLSAMASALTPARPEVSALTGGFRPVVLLSLLSQGSIDPFIKAVPIYRATLLLYGALTIIFFWGSLVAVRRRRRLTRDDAVMLAALLGYALAAFLLRGWWLPGIFPA